MAAAEFALRQIAQDLWLAQGQQAGMGTHQPRQKGRAHMADMENVVAALGQFGGGGGYLVPGQGAAGQLQAVVEEAGAGEVGFTQANHGDSPGPGIEPVREQGRGSGQRLGEGVHLNNSGLPGWVACPPRIAHPACFGGLACPQGSPGGPRPERTGNFHLLPLAEAHRGW